MGGQWERGRKVVTVVIEHYDSGVEGANGQTLARLLVRTGRAVLMQPHVGVLLLKVLKAQE